MATRQGSIDCLCGLYAVLNATEILVIKYAINKKAISQKRALFGELVGYLAKKNKLEKAVVEGINKIDSPGGFLDIAVRSVKKYQKQKMRKQKAFPHDLVSLNEYWEMLTHHLKHGRSSVIICLSGRREHWTCVKEITRNVLILADSSGLKQIDRHQCLIGTEKRGMYTLWPAMTYLLSLESSV
ncbi:MAG: hypothetical protein WCK63_16475 [Betaproteobacteria bacterium]